MYPFEERSFAAGVMDAFNEVIAAEVKKIAFGVPVKEYAIREEYAKVAEEICEKYQTKFYREDELLVTDLFPVSASKDTYNLIFYKYKKDLDEYLELKNQKKELLERGQYCGEVRGKIAYQLGRLLSYSDSVIKEKIEKNLDKE